MLKSDFYLVIRANDGLTTLNGGPKNCNDGVSGAARLCQNNGSFEILDECPLAITYYQKATIATRAQVELTCSALV